MADMQKAAEENYPLEPTVILDLSAPPAHATFNRYLTFQNHAGQRKRLNIAFRKTGPLRWESDSFPDGIDALKSLVDMGNRSYWDHMFLENRGGQTTLPIERLRVTMRYQNPAGLSPAHLNHAEAEPSSRALFTPRPMHATCRDLAIIWNAAGQMGPNIP